jgi:hypothetical protein
MSWRMRLAGLMIGAALGLMIWQIIDPSWRAPWQHPSTSCTTSLKGSS